METKYLSLIITLCFVCFGCKKDSDVIAFDNEVVTLNEHSSIPVEDPLNVEQMNIFEGDKIIIRNFGSDSLFYTYDLGTLKRNKSFGSKGQGPNDYAMPLLINQKMDSIIIFDFGFRKFFQLESFNKNNILKKIQIVDNPLSMKYVKKDKSILLDTKERNELKLKKYLYSGEVKDMYSFADINKMNIPINLKLGYWDILENSNIIYAYQYLPRFDIISPEGKLIKSYSYKNKELPKNSEPIDYENTIVYNFKVISSSDKFYIYRIDKKGKELMDEKNNSVYLDCYSNDGQLIKTYQINHFIKDFIIADNKLIAVNYPEQDSFIIYDLK